MIQRLFVYGSLQPGHTNAHLLEQIGGTWQAASVVGMLRPEGWGAQQGYPAPQGPAYSAAPQPYSQGSMPDFDSLDDEDSPLAHRLEVRCALHSAYLATIDCPNRPCTAGCRPGNRDVARA